MLPLASYIRRDEKFHLAASKEGYGYSILVKQAVAGERRQLRARCQNADEVQRVGARERNCFACRRRAPDLAQFACRFWQSELLAGKSRNKSAAANFSARLEPSIDMQQVSPWGQPSGFSLEQPPEDDTVTQQQGAGHMLGGFRFLLRQSNDAKIPAGERPPSRMFHARCVRLAAASGSRRLALRWQEQRAQPGKTIGGNAANRHKLGYRFFGLRPQEARAFSELVKKRCAMRAQIFRDRLRVWPPLGRISRRCQQRPVLRMTAGKERNRRRAQRRRGRNEVNCIRPFVPPLYSRPGA